MMMINPSSVRAMFSDAAGNAPANPSTDTAGFASLLRQTQVAPSPAPSPSPATPAESKPMAEKAPANDAQDEAPPPQESDAATRTRMLKAKMRSTDMPAPPREARSTPDTRDATDANAAESTDAADKTAADDCKAPETQLTPGEAPIDPSVMHWLAGLQRAAAGPTDEPREGARGKTASTDTDTSAIESRSAAKSTRAADLKADTDLKDKAMQGRTPLTEAAATSPFTAALAEHGGIVEKPLSKVVEGVKDLAAAGATAPARSAGIDAPAPAAVPIATPVTAPDFAHELGLSLAVLAKDGVQTAELHLNPADMGPVSVQIVMDGTQARVDFGADMAATRQAIEAGLPELASALRDAGFTLAGGGVSQHAGGRRGGNDQGTPEARRERGIVIEDEVKRVATAARRIVTNGGVDLFA